MGIIKPSIQIESHPTTDCADLFSYAELVKDSNQERVLGYFQQTSTIVEAKTRPGHDSYRVMWVEKFLGRQNVAEQGFILPGTRGPTGLPKPGGTVPDLASYLQQSFGLRVDEVNQDFVERWNTDYWDGFDLEVGEKGKTFQLFRYATEPDENGLLFVRTGVLPLD